MEFDRDEFDNEVNASIENTDNADINNTCSNDEPRDIDSIIRRHSESLAKAAEDIARNEGSSAVSYDNTQNEDGVEKEVVSSFASNSSVDASADTGVDLEKTQDIQNNINKETNDADNSGSFGETDRGTQSENVRTQAFTTQPQKGKGKSKERKKSKVGRAFGLVASAAVFGLVAGGVMVGVNNVASSYVGTGAKTKVDDIVIGNQDNTKSESTAAPATNLSSIDVSPIVDKAMPSVVSIYGKEQVTQNSFFGPQSYEAQSSGSGIIVGKTDTEAVKLSDMGEDTLSRISIANIGDSDSVKVGQGVVAIGNALGYGQSVTVGYISALNREVKTEGGTSKNLLQTDAAINPGNSGGALLNMQGQVIGINSAKYSDTAVEGMGYAIPISTVKDLIKELSSKETRTVVAQENQGYLGIQGKDIDEEMAKAYDMPQGIYVYKVVEGGAAASSDLKAKDIITKFDGQSVRSMEELKNMLTYYESGRKVDLTVQRLDDSGKYVEKTVSITLGKREAQEQ